MRKKKDDMINELAMKKKQQIMEARMGKRVLTRPSFGGFVGVGKWRKLETTEHKYMYLYLSYLLTISKILRNADSTQKITIFFSQITINFKQPTQIQ